MKIRNLINKLIGEIIFKFEKDKVNGSNIYIYKDKKEIHKEDTIFDNYIWKIVLSNDYKNWKYYYVIKMKKSFKIK